MPITTSRVQQRMASSSSSSLRRSNALRASALSMRTCKRVEVRCIASAPSSRGRSHEQASKLSVSESRGDASVGAAQLLLRRADRQAPGSQQAVQLTRITSKYVLASRKASTRLGLRRILTYSFTSQRQKGPSGATAAAAAVVAAPGNAPEVQLAIPRSGKPGGARHWRPLARMWPLLAELHKPAGLVLSSAYILGTACQLSGVVLASPAWMPAVAGGAVGALFAALNCFGVKRFWMAPRGPLHVVITGSGRGLGKALAREFLRQGDSVVITSRTAAGVRKAVSELRREVGDAPGGRPRVVGLECEVSSAGSVDRLVAAAHTALDGRIDIWINNAGNSGSFHSFWDAKVERIQAVVQTNLTGTLLCTRAAMRAMSRQPTGGHIFSMDGAGADSLPTPQYAAYGATKAGISHLMESLAAELAAAPGAPRVGVHTLSPGMVLTPLLLEGATVANKRFFNILCEQPETTAAFLVPRVRTVVARGEPSRYIKYLTFVRALQRLLTAPLRSNRFFDAQGNPVYAPEEERIMGQNRKATERIARRAALRGRTLALAYSASIAASYLIIVSDSLRAAGGPLG